MTTWLHEQRLAAVMAAVRASGAESIADLGCGEGVLLIRLAEEPAIRRIVGIDPSADALETLRTRLRGASDAIRAKVELIHGSMTDPGNMRAGFDAAILVEAIEHMDSGRLSAVEGAVFRKMRPATVVITTPNSDFNPLLGVPPDRFRHPDHRLEWGRTKFQSWANGVGRRNGYSVRFQDVAGAHPGYGGASQMAIFELRARRGDMAA